MDVYDEEKDDGEATKNDAETNEEYMENDLAETENSQAQQPYIEERANSSTSRSGTAIEIKINSPASNSMIPM